MAYQTLVTLSRLRGIASIQHVRILKTDICEPVTDGKKKVKCSHDFASRQGLGILLIFGARWPPLKMQ